MEADIKIREPPIVDFWQTPEEETWSRFPARASPWDRSWWHMDFELSAFRSVKEKIPAVICYQMCGNLLQQHKEADTVMKKKN